jgi:hypothetical protein
MEGVTGSIPVAPTIFPGFDGVFWNEARAYRFEIRAVQSRFNSKQRALVE